MQYQLKVIIANSTLTRIPNLGYSEGGEKLYSVQTVQL